MRVLVDLGGVFAEFIAEIDRHVAELGGTVLPTEFEPYNRQSLPTKLTG